jgi:hypothetical protein
LRRSIIDRFRRYSAVFLERMPAPFFDGKTSKINLTERKLWGILPPLIYGVTRL